MERIEPTLVPEWLRGTGNVSGSGNSAHHLATSSFHSDSIFSPHSTRNRYSRSVSDKDTPRSTYLDRSSLSNSRHSSSNNGSTKHPYSSFTRSHRDKNRDKEKEESVIGHLWDHDCLDPLGNILISRVDRDTLRHSRSMVSRKPGEVFLRRVVDSKNGGSNNQDNRNGMHSGGSIVSNIQKTAFEKDFPSLGSEEKQGAPDIVRVPSPSLSSAVHSLPMGSSGLIGGEGWTSALAEVPTIIGNNSMGTSSAQQTVVATPSSGASSALSGFNMAEALSQAPSRASTTPQLPDKTQRLEELAIKQSRQLIPMTPSMAKPLVPNSSDKSKPKAAARTSETTVAAKNVQQQQLHSTQLANQFVRGGQIRSDAPRATHTGKFLVLKPVWENGVSSTAKDVSSPSCNASRAANSQLAVAPSAQCAPVNNPNNQKLSTVERNPIASVEKRPSQAQSRSDFFNLMRQKTSTNSPSLPDLGAAVLTPNVKKSGDVIKEVGTPVSPCITENGSELTSNGDTGEEVQRFSDVEEKNSCLNGEIYPNEEEAAFLRSLGWVEDAGEDDGLTEEEINAFYQEYMKQRPSLKVCRGMLPKLSMLSESHASGSSRASSELSSSESESDA